MTRQIFIGLMTEGTTDNRFLDSIVKRTFDEIAFECNGEVETEIVSIKIDKSNNSFVEQVLKASKKGITEFGIMILCVHTDADAPGDENMMNTKIFPAHTALSESEEPNICRVLTALVPVQMIEAWMLADKDLLKREIGTTMTDIDLGLNRNPEQIADPKTLVTEAIRIARAELTRRRRHDLVISDLYLPIGQKITIEKLDNLPSFQKFKESIREAYRKLNYMQ
jgi:hypothetical protein